MSITSEAFRERSIIYCFSGDSLTDGSKSVSYTHLWGLEAPKEKIAISDVPESDPDYNMIAAVVEAEMMNLKDPNVTAAQGTLYNAGAVSYTHLFPFEVEYLVMDPGYSEANRQVIENNARLMEIPVTIFESDIFEAVYEIEKSPCYLCARMRRGHLYSKAKELGCNKIALGHHYDDVIETILMGMLYGGQVQTCLLYTSNPKRSSR